uniref:RNA-guided endonuclease IscB n=1 Tax=Kamptonema formosum TaxID=331992 RepID=UPI000345BB69|nr:RNA-guided endonuclease IscB [Oscillatoria sp. PCC 10802]
MKVFVLDTNRRPLDPTTPRRARKLLKGGKAAVFRLYPFTVILKRAVDSEPVQPLRLKIDPGSKTTGLAIVSERTGAVVWAAELTHRGFQIREALNSRKVKRRNRRYRKTRYRARRFNNRLRKAGWLPPSLNSRVENIVAWVRRLRRFAPISAISQELVRFDTQVIQNPEISGVEYQQGELQGCEVREYLLEKWGRKCAYCGAKETPLEVEHIYPRSKGGSNCVSNLTLACHPCNEKKGNRDVADFLSGKPDLLQRILSAAKAPLKDAAAVNSTRWALYEGLKNTGLPVEAGSGGLTKYNRKRLGLPKTHWLDAACVGESTPENLDASKIEKPLLIKATGRGCRQRVNPDKNGFLISHKSRAKTYQGWATGDIARADIPKGKYTGIHRGRIAIGQDGQFKIQVAHKKRFSVNYKYLTPIQKGDGYGYSF